MTTPTHVVIVHRHARADLQQYYAAAQERGGNQAAAWFDRFIQHLESLAHTPERCQVARESSRVRFELRELLFGRKPNVYRILYTIDGRFVRVLRILRAQRRSPSWRTIEESYFDE